MAASVTATRSEPTQPAPAAADRTHPWRGPQGLAAIAVIAVMLVWRAVLYGGSYFNQDDYFMTSRAYRADLTWDYLFTPIVGHVTPAQQLMYWIVAHTVPFSWNAIAVGILAFQTVATILMWHVLTRLLPDSWVRVPLLAAFAWSSFTLMPSLWWSAAMGLWPLTILSLVAILFTIRLVQDAGSRWINIAVIVGTTIFAFFWHERAVLILPTIFGLCVALSPATGLRRFTWTGRRLWQLWVPTIIALGIYAVLHTQITAVHDEGASFGTYLKIVGSFVVENVVPGILSGPWTGRLKGGAVIPDLWVTVLSCVLVVAGMLALFRYGGRSARWAALLFWGYVLADLLMVLYGRGSFGRVIGLDPRYSSDVMYVAVVSVALALHDSPALRPAATRAARRWPEGRWWDGRRTPLLVGLTGLYLVSSIAGTALLVPHFQNPEDREYFTNLREGLRADKDQVVIDEPVPQDIVLSLVGEDAMASQVIAPMPEAPAFDQPSQRLRRIDENGNLVGITLDNPTRMVPGSPNCGYPVMTDPVTINLENTLIGRNVVHIGYFAQDPATLKVESGSWETTFPTQAGPNEMWFVVPDNDAGVRSLTFTKTDDEFSSAVCISSLEAAWPSAGTD